MKKGFTLVELMVAMSIFIIIMTVSMGSLVGVFEANRKAKALKTALNNLNLAMESMSKEIRFGRDFRCYGGNTPPPRDCGGSGGNDFSFRSSEGDLIWYRFRSGEIRKRIGSNWVDITSSDVIVDDVDFFVSGAEDPNDNLQPKVLILVDGHVGSGEDRTDFTLQTLVSQRFLDI